jgi:hypothetical protein
MTEEQLRSIAKILDWGEQMELFRSLRDLSGRQNPHPEEAFQDCLTKWEQSAAHSILARSVFTPTKAVYICADQPVSSFFACKTAMLRLGLHPGAAMMHAEPLRAGEKTVVPTISLGSECLGPDHGRPFTIRMMEEGGQSRH